LLEAGPVSQDPDPNRRASLLAASSAFLRLRTWIAGPVALLAVALLHAAPGVPAAQRGTPATLRIPRGRSES
jgi:hypothetical protein